MGEQEDNTTYCPICYYNEIVPESRACTAEDSAGTIEFDCKHRFCKDCTIEMLKQQIERADVDKIKCFDSECLKPIEKTRLT